MTEFFQLRSTFELALLVLVTNCRRATIYFHAIVGSHVLQSMDTFALDHSRVKMPLFGAVSLQTFSSGVP